MVRLSVYGSPRASTTICFLLKLVCAGWACWSPITRAGAQPTTRTRPTNATRGDLAKNIGVLLRGGLLYSRFHRHGAARWSDSMEGEGGGQSPMGILVKAGGTA